MAGRGWQPLMGAALQVDVPEGGCRPCGLATADRARGRLLPPRERRWPPFRAGPSGSRLSPCRGPWSRPDRG
ncbi:hypothetical protein B296_00012239 [Ensete ventricosum]|uniref:Uncharacterized protein n=1 Tax=Ensete ventricosum TaxID=4639 RepID=A0A426XDE1_ENSVE|nr:hypothetical protein B296_00012239 [Ensete ventricosum]